MFQNNYRNTEFTLTYIALGSGLSFEKYFSYNSGEAYFVNVFNCYKVTAL
nr:MAG TPA: hypothetical protein [Bacteriophage sp.]